MDVKPDCLILDAMGVLYPCCDDVVEVLVPYLRDRGVGQPLLDEVHSRYHALRVGQVSTSTFLEGFGVDPSLEDDYLSRFRLSDGLLHFLTKARGRFRAIHCLSNDASEWSLKNRRQFGLEAYVDRWFISGDMKCKKPEPEIYVRMLSELDDPDPATCLFVDDRVKNLDAAADLGFQTVLFMANRLGEEERDTRHRQVHSFGEILAML